jgi:hypothetical protein
LPGADDAGPRAFTPEIADHPYINMELALPCGDADTGEPTLAQVKRWKLDANGVPIGVAHKNPILDTRVFEVEFLDGHTASMTANAIAENLFSQVNKDGN